MNYHQLAKGLLKEAKKGIQFERMNTPVKVVLIIGLIPLIVLAFVSVASFYITLFFYKAGLVPVEYLHKLVKTEGKEVMHASQFAIYWISWPFVFLLYVMQSFTAVVFYIQWFFMMVFVYLATLGGVRWQPIMSDATFDSEEIYSVKPGETGLLVYTSLLGLIDLLLAIGIVTDLFSLAGYSTLAVMVMLCIVNPFVFKKEVLVPQEESFAQDNTPAV